MTQEFDEVGHLRCVLERDRGQLLDVGEPSVKERTTRLVDREVRDADPQPVSVPEGLQVREIGRQSIEVGRLEM